MSKVMRDKGGRFTKSSRIKHREKRTNNAKKLNETSKSSCAGTKCEEYFDASYCTIAAGSTTDHTYTSATLDSFDDINNLFFAGKLKPLNFTRFVVDLQTFFENFACSNCQKPLYIKDSVGVLPVGVSGYVVIKCSNCFSFSKVAMGKTHPGKNRGPRVFDVNSKLATGMYHIGIGPVQLNNFLAAVNLPMVSEKMVQRRCEEVGTCLEDLARDSADYALQQEVLLTKQAKVFKDENLTNQMPSDESHVQEQQSGQSQENQKDKTSNDVKGITASADGAYQRRGSGRCHNSLSGTASLIGKSTGKVISFAARAKRCRICTVAKKRNRIPRKHECKKNSIGSAKSMEPDMVVDMLRDVKEKNAPVQVLIGDDDSTGFNRARNEVSSTLEKISDTNHVKKNITNQLYKLKSKCKDLSVKSINAIMKSFSYMLAQSKGDKTTIKNNLSAVVEHQYGNHGNCGSWCRMAEDPEAKHRNLPWGADLTNQCLRADHHKIFTSLDADKLSKLDTSNRNESFNNILRSKAPKDKHYSESKSLNHRLCAAVCQKNEGYNYVSKIHEKLGMSPGNATSSMAMKRDKDVARKQKISRTRKFKLRRIQLKSERSEENKSLEVREGDTYTSNITDGKRALDLEVIPGPDASTFEVPSPSDYTSVVFDLETTGLSRSSSIVQIAAVCREKTFNRYCTPQQPMSSDAEQVTGIKFHESSGKMYQNDEEVQHDHLMTVLLDFVQFLESCGKNVILIAHNSRKFDSTILYNNLKYCNLWSHFCKYVFAFTDTLPFYRKMYPHFENHKQITLVTNLLNETYAAHNALADCTYLEKLIQKEPSCDLLFTDFIFYPSQISSYGVQPAECSLEKLVQQKIISKGIAQKLSKSALTYQHLELAYRRDGLDGLFSLLGERNSEGKLRVTKCSKVVAKISHYFHFEE